MKLSLWLTVFMSLVTLGHLPMSAQSDRYIEFRTPIGQCLLDHEVNKTLDQLLNSDLVQEASGREAIPEKKYYTKMQQGYRTVRYSWKGNRTREMTVGKTTMTIAVDDEIGLGTVGTFNPAYFDNAYHTPSEEEKAEMKRLMADALDTTETAATEIHQKAGSALSGTLIDGMKFESVEGVGDKAAWDISGSRLVVLTGDVTFYVLVNMEMDWRSNMRRSIPIAQKILESCK